MNFGLSVGLLVTASAHLKTPNHQSISIWPSKHLTVCVLSPRALTALVNVTKRANVLIIASVGVIAPLNLLGLSLFMLPIVPRGSGVLLLCQT